MTNRSSPAWRAGGSHAVAAHKARPAPAFRSTKSSARCDALPTCVFPLSREDSRRPVGKPWLRSSSNLPDRCAPPLATEDRVLLPNAFLFRSSARLSLWFPPSGLRDEPSLLFL